MNLKYLWVALFIFPSLLWAEFDSTGSDEFDFYFGEFVENQLEPDHKMLDLIEDGLVEAVFQTTNADAFKSYIQLLQQAAIEMPERARQFESLDDRLDERFQSLIKEAERKKWIYSATGLVLGAVVGIPIGKLIGSSIGRSILWISVPAGALLGGGAGFLLSDLLHSPDYQYTKGSITTDLDRYREEFLGED